MGQTRDKVKEQWQEAMNGRHYLGSFYGPLSNIVVAVSGELSGIVNRLKSDWLSLGVAIALVTVGITGMLMSSYTAVMPSIKRIDELVIAFIGIAITTAIFIASINRSNQIQQRQLIASLNADLSGFRPIFGIVFDELKDGLDDMYKADLMLAHCALTVSDQKSYQQFVEWSFDHANYISNEGYRSEFEHPYQMSTTSERRKLDWIKRGISLIHDLPADKTAILEKRVTDIWVMMDKLKPLIYKYPESELYSDYSLSGLLNSKLGRLVFYGAAANCMLILLDSIIAIQLNVFKAIDFHLDRIVAILAIMITCYALILCTSYLFSIINYFKSTTVNYPTYSFYPVQDDNSQDEWGMFR